MIDNISRPTIRAEIVAILNSQEGLELSTSRIWYATKRTVYSFIVREQLGILLEWEVVKREHKKHPIMKQNHRFVEDEKGEHVQPLRSIYTYKLIDQVRRLDVWSMAKGGYQRYENRLLSDEMRITEKRRQTLIRRIESLKENQLQPMLDEIKAIDRYLQEIKEMKEDGGAF